MLYFLIVLFLGFVAGFLSGLLAVGGGIIVIPVFLYLMPLLGYSALSVSNITGISSVQVIMGSLFAFLAHKKFGLMDKNLLYNIGLSAAIGALAGSIISKYIPANGLLIIYFVTLTISFIALLIQKNSEINPEKSFRNPVLASASAVITGMLAGSIGVGGAVLFIPILSYFYGMPIRASISNATYLVLITAIMTFIGKTSTSQVPFDLVIFVIVGAFLGARAGTFVSHKFSPSVLRKILLFIVLITAVRVLFSII